MGTEALPPCAERVATTQRGPKPRSELLQALPVNANMAFVASGCLACVGSLGRELRLVRAALAGGLASRSVCWKVRTE